MKAKENTEYQYLLACLGHKIFSLDKPPDIPPGMDWDAFFNLLIQHRLTGLYYSLSYTQRKAFPASFRENLRNEHFAWMIYGDRSGEKARSVLAALRDDHIAVIVLKGWAAIPGVYGGDSSQRFCEDIDLLVRSQDIDPAARILQQQAFQAAEETWPGYARRFTNCQAFVTPLSNPDSQCFSVGLHWGLFHMPAFDPKQVNIEMLFVRAQPLQVLDVSVMELNPEDQIVYSCSHLGLHHKYDPSLFRYYELATTIHQNQDHLVWDDVLRLAQAWNCIIPLQQVLQELHGLWPGIIPVEEMERIRSLRADRREHFVNRWIKLFKNQVTFLTLLNWLTIPGVKNKLAMAFQDILPGAQYMRRRYGSGRCKFLPWLYLLRFFRSIGFAFRRYRYTLQNRQKGRSASLSSGAQSE